jgi:hypothetical protein
MRKPSVFLALVVTLTAAFWASSPGAKVLAAAGTCTVSMLCPRGGTVSCSGTTCRTGLEYVECDNRRTYCYPEGCPARIQCAYGGIIECDSQRYCEQGTDYVYCDGVGTITCSNCDPSPYCSTP